jgi:hypothetical protein
VRRLEISCDFQEKAYLVLNYKIQLNILQIYLKKWRMIEYCVDKNIRSSVHEGIGGGICR